MTDYSIINELTGYEPGYTRLFEESVDFYTFKALALVLLPHFVEGSGFLLVVGFPHGFIVFRIKLLLLRLVANKRLTLPL